MAWELVLAGPAARALKRMPAAERRRVLAALDAMEQNPFSGDIVRLTAHPVAWRRRVGNWRLLFDIGFSGTASSFTTSSGGPLRRIDGSRHLRVGLCSFHRTVRSRACGGDTRAHSAKVPGSLRMVTSAPAE